MKVGPLTPASLGIDADPAASTVVKNADGAAAKTAIDPEKLRLAREFEQIFIRKMLASLEKSGKSAEPGRASAGGDAYGSMVVSALAEAVSNGGGIGLAEVIARAASQPIASLSTTAAQLAVTTPAPVTTEPAPAAATPAAAPTVPGASGAPSNDLSGLVGAAHVTVPHGVRITSPATAPRATYSRPSPPIIFQGKR